ncbi:uncharacterized protein LOC131686867 [Topomyia yanbarensis]|uniref:uncharacterized protein LOC131686867 n=1 Tax=Topomyia yanbarensis TaxID=2498891 RepID=UPI00273AEEE8|nr:uncharacterized protein LOC131686867 [Topomyia yanbarensis]
MPMIMTKSLGEVAEVIVLRPEKAIICKCLDEITTVDELRGALKAQRNLGTDPHDDPVNEALRRNTDILPVTDADKALEVDKAIAGWLKCPLRAAPQMNKQAKKCFGLWTLRGGLKRAEWIQDLLEMRGDVLFCERLHAETEGHDLHSRRRKQPSDGKRKTVGSVFPSTISSLKLFVMSTFIQVWSQSRRTHSIARARHNSKKLKQSTAIFLDATIRSTNIQARKSLKILDVIVNRTDREILQCIPEMRSILECSLILVQTYVAHLKLRHSFFDRFKRQPYANAKKCFQALIHLLIPEMQGIVIDTILSFLQRENLWKVEFICVEILVMVLECKSPAALLLCKMIDYVETLLTKNDVSQARHAVVVLQNIIQPQYWSSVEYWNMSKLLRFYHSSAIIGESKNQIYELRRGFEICLRNLIKVLTGGELTKLITTMLPLTFDTDLPDEAMLEFGKTVEYAASTLVLTETTVPEEPYIVEYLLIHICSESPSKSLLASRIFTKMLDRGNNFLQFGSPRIFHGNTFYEIDINQYNSARREMFDIYRVEFEAAIVSAFELHSKRRINLDILYNVMCMVLVEIPCGLTSCAIVCLLLKVQRKLLESPETFNDQQQTNCIHATIISIMTLINWIHRGPSLTAYINTILNRRFDHAPHLNPPLLEIYQYAQHHITWNDSILFFDALELRYGLWKCFRIHESKNPAPTQIYSRLGAALTGAGSERKRRRQKTGFYRIGLTAR